MGTLEGGNDEGCPVHLFVRGREEAAKARGSGQSDLSWDFGAGESAVLAWCLAHPGSEAIIDDLSARRCAATSRRQQPSPH